MGKESELVWIARTKICGCILKWQYPARTYESGQGKLSDARSDEGGRPLEKRRFRSNSNSTERSSDAQVVVIYRDLLINIVVPVAV